jgi:hypothetical protein
MLVMRPLWLREHFSNLEQTCKEDNSDRDAYGGLWI